MYLCSNISSTECYVNLCIGKALTATDKLKNMKIWLNKMRILLSCVYIALHHLDGFWVEKKKLKI